METTTLNAHGKGQPPSGRLSANLLVKVLTWFGVFVLSASPGATQVLRDSSIVGAKAQMSFSLAQNKLHEVVPSC